MATYLFPGLGSHYKGMGSGLFKNYPQLVATANEILGFSVQKLCVHDPQKQLSNFQFVQPALFVVNALTYLQKIENTGKIPDHVAGHSLGEYNALWAAGVFDFETGLKLAIKNSEMVNQSADYRMAAVIGLNEIQIKEILFENDLNALDIAVYNSRTQIVLGGPKNDIERGRKAFETVKVKMYIVLNINCAFHTRYMRSSKEQFEEFLAEYTFLNPMFPVISNVTATPYHDREIKSNLANQIISPERWFDSIKYLMDRGETDFEEIGPGKVLTLLLQKIKANE
jgi:trans-AT polyketide synthase/acyltransferase/oxidoreductase domain-containing protein